MSTTSIVTSSGSWLSCKQDIPYWLLDNHDFVLIIVVILILSLFVDVMRVKPNIKCSSWTNKQTHTHDYTHARTRLYLHTWLYTHTIIYSYNEQVYDKVFDKFIIIILSSNLFTQLSIWSKSNIEQIISKRDALFRIAIITKVQVLRINSIKIIKHRNSITVFRQ